ncbi:ribosomal-processing cysteine protease Prp [Caproiciproducens sp. MSJ-32]|uniref:ribosomal-processing cysteine protease Prp n=1 Tax=Caproiciproducens sp. MSJ-32 TaxID=2841527 RepID=UPI001C103F4E|nr:ribosomal-processing cysteine protease Prp [Caproiciproducens sp. MSJ-32]MBU5455933.1 ribosomal-processing cysteine protease Prp [Caproiciproducens sp. MSJ-32]
MIKIEILKKENSTVGFKISGHALSQAEMKKSSGLYDLICNSVSVLSQSVVIGIEEVLGIKTNYEMRDGYLYLNISNLKSEDIDKCQLLLLTFEKSIESVIESIKLNFGKKQDAEYIRLVKEEVY